MKYIVMGAALVALMLAAGQAVAYPTLPDTYWGWVNIAGTPAPPGTLVGAYGEGVHQDPEHQNPVVVVDEGRFGWPDWWEQCATHGCDLIVQGKGESVEEWTPIYFTINGEVAKVRQVYSDGTPVGYWEDYRTYHGKIVDSILLDTDPFFNHVYLPLIDN